jgi:hypothetical protein
LGVQISNEHIYLRPESVHSIAELAMSPEVAPTHEIEADADQLLLLGSLAHSEAQKNGFNSLAYFQAAGISYQQASAKYQSVMATRSEDPELMLKEATSLIGLSGVEAATKRGNLNRVSSLRMNGLDFIAAAQKIFGEDELPRNIETAMAAVNADATLLLNDPHAADDILATAEVNASPSMKRLLEDKRKYPWHHPAAEIVLRALGEAA